MYQSARRCVNTDSPVFQDIDATTRRQNILPMKPTLRSDFVHLSRTIVLKRVGETVSASHPRIYASQRKFSLLSGPLLPRFDRKDRSRGHLSWKHEAKANSRIHKETTWLNRTSSGIRPSTAYILAVVWIRGKGMLRNFLPFKCHISKRSEF